MGRRPGQESADEADVEGARAAMSRLKAQDPQEPGRWGVGRVRCMLAGRGCTVGSEARTSAINYREVLLTTAPEELRLEVPRDGGAEALEVTPCRAAEGAPAPLGALADLWAAARDVVTST